MEDLKKISSKKLTIISILAFIILLFQIFNLFTNGREALKVNYIKEEISILKDDVDKIYKSEKELDKKIETFNFEIKKIHEGVNINNQKIENLKKDEKNQMDKFKSYDASMWERYFTDRYSKN